MTETYIPARQHGGTDNLVPTRVVIHCTVSPTVVGGALEIADMFHTTSRDASAHHVHDPATSIRCLPDSVVGYHAPPNIHSLGREMCDPQSGSAARWADALHVAMMRLCAQGVAADCVKYKIPIVKISSKDLLAGKHGICGHIDVTDAWHQTTHTDPGLGFPWTTFISLVKYYAKNPTPAPPGGNVTAGFVSGSATVDQPLVPGVRKVLLMTTLGVGSKQYNGVSIAGGPGIFTGEILIYGTGLDKTQLEIQPYIAVPDGKGGYAYGGTVDSSEGAGTPGSTLITRGVTTPIAAGNRLRVYVTLVDVEGELVDPKITKTLFRLAKVA